MKPYINLLGVSIPSYGLMIVIGVLILVISELKTKQNVSKNKN